MRSEIRQTVAVSDDQKIPTKYGSNHNQAQPPYASEVTHIQPKPVMITSDQPILLDVGGVLYKTSLSTLSKYPNSGLYQMIEGKISLKENEDGSYFIDRNGKYFHIILDYMRNDGIVLLPDHDRKYLMRHLFLEAQFYQIIPLMNYLRENIMSWNSDILSVDKFKMIQNLIHPNYTNKHYFEWKLLFKQHGVHSRNIVNTIKNQKAILVILRHKKHDKKHDHLLGLYINEPINFYSNEGQIDSLKKVMAFRLCLSTNKIEDEKFKITSIYYSGRKLTVQHEGGEFVALNELNGNLNAEIYQRRS